jgi:hypothetical protein
VHDEYVPIAHHLSTTAPRAGRAGTASLLRARVLLSRTSLDAQLARGDDAQHSPQLALRAAQLCALTTRRPLGRTILALLDRAQSRRTYFTSAAPLCAEAIAYARPALIQLAVALQSPEPARAQGVAQVMGLLRDAAGPLHATSDQPSALYFAARRALLTMRPCAASCVELVEHGQEG